MLLFEKDLVESFEHHSFQFRVSKNAFYSLDSILAFPLLKMGAIYKANIRHFLTPPPLHFVQPPAILRHAQQVCWPCHYEEKNRRKVL